MTQAVVSTTARLSIPPQILSAPASVISPYADFIPQAVPPSTDIASEPNQRVDDLVAIKTTKKLVHPSKVARLLDGMHIRYDSYVATRGIEVPYKAVFKPLSPTLVPLKKSGRGRPSTVMVNSLKPHLTFYNEAKDALDDLPMLDDIVTGAVQLNLDGNTRPLNKNMMIEMLQDLKFISSDAVESWMGCEKRHAQKVAKCLRIIVTLSMRVVDSWPEPFMGDRWVDEEPTIEVLEFPKC
jgi:hypothetical protein